MDDTDFPGRTFFSRSLFRSGEFLFVLGMLVMLVVGASAFLLAFWNRMPWVENLLLLVIVCWYPIQTTRTAVLRHGELRRTYFQRDPAEPALEHFSNPALDVAAKATIEGLFYQNVSLLVLLFFLAMVLRKTK